jgi:hypothetical protein
MLTAEEIEGFASFFRGRTDARGAIDGGCIRKAVTIDSYRYHLQGKAGLGIYLLTNDNRVRFSASDIDIQDVTIPRRIRETLSELNIPSYIALSKGKGFHLYTFYLEPVPAAKVRELYRRVQNTLGMEHEIFPKQDTLPPDGLGNYINLPYFGTTRPFIGFDQEGKPHSVPLVDFLNRVKVVSEDHLDRAVEQVPPVTKESTTKSWVVDLLSKPIKSGLRDESITRLAGYFHSKDIVREVTEAILNNVTIEKGDHDFGAEDIVKCVNSVYKYPGRDQKSLEVMSMLDLLKAPDGGLEYLVSGIIPVGGMCILAGDPEAGKTWLLLDIATTVAQGKPFLGRFPVVQGTAFIIDEENGKRRLAKRQRLLGVTEGLPIYFSCMRGINLSDPAWEEPLRRVLEQIKPKLVTIDSLIRVHRGDENDAGEMAKFFATVTKLREEYGCAFLITHHLRKRAQVTRLNGINERLRGSSDISAYADTVIGLDKLDGRLILSQLKNRDGDYFKPLALAIEDTGDGRVDIKVLEEIDVEADKKKQARDLIRKTLKEKPLLREELLSLAKCEEISERTLTDAIKNLVDTGELNKEPEGHKVKYSLK